MFKKVQKKSKIYVDIKKSFFSIILISILFNFFVSGILNFNSQLNKLDNINFVSAELQNNISTKEKGKIEEYLLNIPEIKKVIYVDSYIAFRNLQSDLGIVIPRGENPLPDSMRIYFDSKSSLEKIQDILDKDKRIKEYFIDGSYSEEIGMKSKIYRGIKNILLFGSISSLAILYFIISLQIQSDYLALILNGKSNARTKLKAKNINVLQFTVAILSGTVIYYNIYFILRQWLLTLDIKVDILSLFQIIYFQSLIIFLLIIIVWKFPVNEKSEIL
ncbi:MAG: permease-like cell division protein FtsX [Fusobacterium sp. JB021]|nr:permease-like cell division protein FtsX [Fusobacterium sp. JB020]MDP0494310.1 permease-like cell division protein FtsX [Fusobacterium sp. JB021]MDP0506321.1 permease-like cell division protein FtsX [Fusobacterium sp. JB019]